MLNQIEYYRCQNVKKRLAEFIRGAEYIVGYGECEVWNQNPKAYYSAPSFHLDGMISRGLDIFASMLNNNGTLISLDIEYYNPKYPGEIYLNAANVFKNKLQPIREIVKNTYRDFGIDYLEVITGQGYHYHTIWPFKNEHNQLEKIGRIEYTLEQQYLHRTSQHGYPNIPAYKGLGYSGAFRLLQFVTIEIMHRVNGLRMKNPKILPVQYCDIEMSPQEGVSLDLTIYSDPIYMRDIRAPFSTHQKHKVKRHELGEHVGAEIPVQITLPTSNLQIDELMKMRRHFRMASEYAGDPKSSCLIPDAHNGWLNVLSKYKTSKLCEFHKKFDSIEHDKEEDWHRTYYGLNLSELPPCAAHSVLNPEPHLKKPTNIRTIVSILSKKGWEFKHIAGFFYSRYKNLSDFSPNKYNAEIRANFFVQLYGGPLYVGLDKKTDLNCVSYKEIGYCMQPWCGYNLEWWG